MKKKVPFILVILLMIGFNPCTAQPNPDDTLRAVLKTGTKEQVYETYEKFVRPLYNSNPQAVLEYAVLLEKYADSLDMLKGKALAYRFYASAYDSQSDYQKSLRYWKLQMAVELELGNRKNVAYTHMIIAATYNSLNYPDSAKISFEQCYEILKDLDDKRGLGFYYANLAKDLDKRGNLRAGMKAKYEALKISESIKDSLQIAMNLSAIGTSYNRLAEFEQAIQKYEESLEILLKLNNKTQAFHTYSNLGVAYNSLQQHQKALEAYQHSLDFAREFNYEYGQAIASMNIAELLLELNRPDSVLSYLEYSAGIFTKLGTKHPLCYNFKVFGNYYREIENTEQASQHLLEAFRLSRELEAPDIHRDAALGLYRLYKNEGGFEAALQYHEIFKQYSDSLLNAENISELTKLEEQFKFEQQQKETDILHQAALDKKQDFIVLTSSGLTLAIMLLSLVILQYRRKNSAYNKLYEKNMAQLRASEIKRKSEGLKNGELFEQLEQNMQDEHLYRIKDLSQDMVADMLKTNRTYVSQAIIDHSGKRFREYIKEYRVKEAMEILTDPKKSQVYSIDAISEMVGFNSIATFNAAFKQITGLTPSQFRSRAG